MENNITNVSEALLCSNCGACKAICPKNAISFSQTPLGRMFAIVNSNCIDCGLCTKVCPSLDKQSLNTIFKDRFVGNIKKVYVGKSTDAKIFKNSQSGGICTAIIAYLFDIDAIDCAVLCRMDYGKPPVVKSFVIDNKEKLADCQKSCYTPVDLLSALKETVNKKSVAIVGLPCHIQGVESLLRCSRKFHNVHYKIGLICDRTLCSGIQNVMLSFTPPEKAKIIWRNKNTIHTYKNAPVTIVGIDGKERVLPNAYRFALKDYFTSPRCRVCYDKLNTFADVVCGDPWGMSSIDWQHGESVVITRTTTGEQLIENMIKTEYVSLSERNVDELLQGQHIDARRIQVAAYSEALKVIPQKTDSYLYKQNVKGNLNVQKEKDEITDFLRRETLSQEDMIKETRKTIALYMARQKINKLVIVKILRKIKKSLKL